MDATSSGSAARGNSESAGASLSRATGGGDVSRRGAYEGGGVVPRRRAAGDPGAARAATCATSNCTSRGRTKARPVDELKDVALIGQAVKERFVLETGEIPYRDNGGLAPFVGGFEKKASQVC